MVQTGGNGAGGLPKNKRTGSTKNGGISPGWYETLNRKAFLEFRATAIIIIVLLRTRIWSEIRAVVFLPFSTHPSAWLSFIYRLGSQNG